MEQEAPSAASRPPKITRKSARKNFVDPIEIETLSKSIPISILDKNDIDYEYNYRNGEDWFKTCDDDLPSSTIMLPKTLQLDPINPEDSPEEDEDEVPPESEQTNRNSPITKFAIFRSPRSPRRIFNHHNGDNQPSSKSHRNLLRGDKREDLLLDAPEDSGLSADLISKFSIQRSPRTPKSHTDWKKSHYHRKVEKIRSKSEANGKVEKRIRDLNLPQGTDLPVLNELELLSPSKLPESPSITDIPSQPRKYSPIKKTLDLKRLPQPDFNHPVITPDDNSLSASESHRNPQLQQHELVLKHFLSPVRCSSCEGYIWGLTRKNKEGFRCKKCSISVHTYCKNSINENCPNDKKNENIIKKRLSLPLDHYIPQIIEKKFKRKSNKGLKDQILLLDNGYIVGSYDNTGNILLNNLYTKFSPTIIYNAHPTIIMKGIFPIIFSAHMVPSDSQIMEPQTFIQIYNIRTRHKVEKKISGIQTLVMDKSIIIITTTGFYSLSIPFDDDTFSEEAIRITQLHIVEGSPNVIQNLSLFNTTMQNNKIIIQSHDNYSIQLWELSSHYTVANCIINTKIFSPINHSIISQTSLIISTQNGHNFFKITPNLNTVIISDGKRPISFAQIFQDIERYIFIGDIYGNIKQIDETTLKIHHMLNLFPVPIPGAIISGSSEPFPLDSSLASSFQDDEGFFPLSIIHMIKIKQFLIIAVRSGIMICSINLKNQTSPLVSLELNNEIPCYLDYKDDLLYICCRKEDDQMEENFGELSVLLVLKLDWSKLVKKEMKAFKQNL